MTHLLTCPPYAAAVWENGIITNKGEIALWSGKAPPPPVGAVVICNDKPGTRCTVTGYEVNGGWLMVTGFRTDSPCRTGNLSGYEIARLEGEGAANG